MHPATRVFMVRFAVLGTVSLIMLAVVVASDLRAQPQSGPQPQPTTGHEGGFAQPTVIHDKPAEQAVYVLTDEQKEQAVDIASNDQRVRSLLDAHQSEITDIIIWTGDEARVMGAAVTMSFSEPTTVTGEWLSLSWSCEQQPLPPPESVPYTATFASVTSILVFSNLQTAEVDQIAPFRSEGVTLVGDRVFTGETKSITSCYED